MVVASKEKVMVVRSGECERVIVVRFRKRERERADKGGNEDGGQGGGSDSADRGVDGSFKG
ncbi:hypothetical protein Syun_027522 [Stephania yunnanensis]|uniref:Uncharacterized protein n=1 Tax=Stephania yunnanensis TaxID=152371 RepID=A0AAP0HQA5_9MAGN